MAVFVAHVTSVLTSYTLEQDDVTIKGKKVGVKDYFLCLFSKRIVCKSEPEVHFYRKLRYARED